MSQITVPHQRMKMRIVLHPILFAVFPTAFLYFYNFGHVTPTQLVLPIGFTLFSVVGVWLALEVVYKNIIKSGLATSCFFLLFFAFGHAFEALSADLSLFNRYALLLVLWPIVFLLCGWWLKKTNLELLPFSNWLNVMGVALIGLSVVPGEIIASPYTQGFNDQVAISDSALDIENLPKPSRLPDIYYVMLDGYAGADVLQDVFGYDNSSFLEFLRQEKFYVAEAGQANYCQTWLSLTASLNLNYVDQLLETQSIDSDDRKPLRTMIQNNFVVKFLRNYGYTFVSFESGKAFTDMDTADIVLPQKPVVDEFLVTLVRSTPLLGLLYVAKELDGERHIPLPSTSYQAHRDRITYALEHLPTLTKQDSPLFVFAHILAPHPPFVFGPTGEAIEPEREYYAGDGSAFYEHGGTKEEYLHDYKGQVQFLNAKLRTMIEEILRRSSEPPIIILQADHGSRMKLDWNDLKSTDLRESFSIFSALHLPGVKVSSAYQNISPVNTFRLVFNAYFGTDLPILENKSYYSTWEHPYQFINVTEQIM